MRKIRKLWLTAGVLGAGVLLSAAANAGITDRIGEILKKQGEQGSQTDPSGSTRGDEVAQLVDREAASMDTALRALEGNPREASTKVVPILVAGQAKAIGAAQVYGGSRVLRSVEAVVASDVSLAGKKLQGRIYLPTSTRDLSKGYTRVQGVAVMAIMEYKP